MMARERTSYYDQELVEAAKRGDIDTMKTALGKGANIDATYGLYSPSIETIYHFAASEGWCEAMTFAKNHGCDVNALNWYEQNAYSLAAENGHIEAMKLAKSHGCKVNTVDRIKNAYSLAALHGHTEAMKLAKEHGCDVLAVDFQGHNAYQSAALHGHTEAMELAQKDWQEALSRQFIDFCSNLMGKKHTSVTDVTVPNNEYEATYDRLLEQFKGLPTTRYFGTKIDKTTPQYRDFIIEITSLMVAEQEKLEALQPTQISTAGSGVCAAEQAVSAEPSATGEAAVTTTADTGEGRGEYHDVTTGVAEEKSDPASVTTEQPRRLDDVLTDAQKELLARHGLSSIRPSVRTRGQEGYLPPVAAVTEQRQR